MGPETLILQLARIHTAQPLELGHDRRKLLGLDPDQPAKTVGAKRRSKIAQRVNDDGERQDLLHLGGPPAQHEMTLIIGSRAKLVQQTRLTDARLTAQDDDRRLAIPQEPQRLGQCRQLCPPANNRRLATNGAARNMCHGDSRATHGGCARHPDLDLA